MMKVKKFQEFDIQTTSDKLIEVLESYLEDLRDFSQEKVLYENFNYKFEDFTLMEGVVEFAKRELQALNGGEVKNDYDGALQKGVLDLLKVFAKQGHSGFSAPYAISMFSKLANFEPLKPIMCTDDEWKSCAEMGDPESYQNQRCYSIFKKGKEGKPYFLDAIIWKDPKDITFTGTVEGIGSAHYIKVPFEPKKFYVDVVKDGEDWKIKDPSQLDEVFEYYEKREKNK